jgi:hypothetical protein
MIPHGLACILSLTHNFLAGRVRLGTSSQCPEFAGTIGPSMKKPGRYRLIESTTEKEVPRPPIRQQQLLWFGLPGAVA